MKEPVSSTQTDDDALSTVIQRFEDAWQNGSLPPEPTCFLHEVRESYRSTLMEELVKVDLEFRWRATTSDTARYLLDDYVERFQDCLPTDFPSKELIGEEFWVRQCWGDKPAISDYVQRFPGVDGLEIWLNKLRHSLKEESSRRPPNCIRIEDGPVRSSSHISSDDPLPRFPGYSVSGILGRGGMAVVYQAHDMELGRDVAIKIARNGDLVSKSDATRFRREIEAVAQLRSPNIVAIYQVGEVDGQLFYVMELADCGNLSDKLSGVPQDAKEAATLARTIAIAIDTAHQASIIHRDLKPSNILLSQKLERSSDSLLDYEPKIADFGLVKRLDSTHHTQTGDVLGTPAYMSPEQIVQGGEVTPATDVHAVGTILYELLTGRPPFQGSSVLETLELVRSRDPVPPTELQPSVPKDLGTICLKCLQKEAGRRYRSGAELAADLERFLAGRPIDARPISKSERAVKWARRHPAAAALVIVSLFALATLIVGGWTFNSRLSQALKEKSAESARANRNFDDASEAVNRMLDRVAFDALRDVPGTETLREELLTGAVEYFEKLLSQSTNPDPSFHRYRQQAYQHLGAVRMEMDQLADAQPVLLKALALQEQALEEGMADTVDYQSLARAHLSLALLWQRMSRTDQAEERFRLAIELVSRHSEAIPALRTELGLAYNNLANLLSAIGNSPEAEALLMKAIAMREQLLQETPEHARLRHDLARSRSNLGQIYIYTGRPGTAKPYCQQAYEGFRVLAEANPMLANYQADLAECCSALATIAGMEGDVALSLQHHEQALDIRTRMTRLYPGVLAYHDMTARSHHNLAAALQRQQQIDRAIAELCSAIEIRERLLQESPDSTGFLLQLSESQNSLALIYAGNGRVDEARNLFDQAIEALQNLASESAEIRPVTSLAATRSNLGNLLRDVGEVDAGLEQFGLAIAALTQKLINTPSHIEVRNFLRNAYGSRAITLGNQKRFADAVEDWNHVVDLATDTQRRGFRLLRATILARIDPAGAVREAESLRDHAFVASDQYNLACVYSIAAAKVKEDAGLTEAARARARSKYVATALELLADDDMAEYFGEPGVVKHLAADPDLVELQSENDFQQLIRKLKSRLGSVQ